MTGTAEGTVGAGALPGEWRRLSPWAILHFAQKAVIDNVRGLVFAGAPAAFGASQWGSARFLWMVPVGIIVAVMIGAVVTTIFYRYRLLDDSIQVRRGAVTRRHLNLTFDRIQNVSIEHPFYFRPLERVTLKIDGAGAQEEEISVAALAVPQAEAVRRFILSARRRLAPSVAQIDGDADQPDGAELGELVYRRSVGDLVVHGLTNNRAFIAVAALLGFLAQSGLTPAEIAARLGIDFDIVFAGLSLVRLVVLVVIAFVASIGIIALLSVLVSIVTYYGFSVFSTPDALTIKRGLLTKHEIHVKKSRIQSVQTRQDWLDRLLGRHNVILERITHASGNQDPTGASKSRILIPSVRVAETSIVTDEILPGIRVEQLEFTPIDIRYFAKRAAAIAVIWLACLVPSVLLSQSPLLIGAALTALAIVLIARAYLGYRRGGLALDGDIVIARSGAIGVDYRLFAAEKIQDVTHVQSLLMRRRGLSTLRFHTASAAVSVPHMPTEFMRRVVDYCVFRVETTGRSWM